MPESTNAADLVPTIVTQRHDGLSGASTTAVTTGDQPNVQVIAMPGWKIVAVRATRVYLQALVGFMTAAGVGLDQNLFPDELGARLIAAAQLALAPMVFSMLTNATELLAKLDVSFPQSRA